MVLYNVSPSKHMGIYIYIYFCFSQVSIDINGCHVCLWLGVMLCCHGDTGHSTRIQNSSFYSLSCNNAQEQEQNTTESHVSACEESFRWKSQHASQILCGRQLRNQSVSLLPAECGVKLWRETKQQTSVLQSSCLTSPPNVPETQNDPIWAVHTQICLTITDVKNYKPHAERNVPFHRLWNTLTSVTPNIVFLYIVCSMQVM